LYEDVVEVETPNVGGALEELLCVLGQQLVLLVDPQVVLQLLFVGAGAFGVFEVEVNRHL